MKKILFIILFIFSFTVSAQLVPATKLNNANFYGGIWIRDILLGTTDSVLIQDNGFIKYRLISGVGGVTGPTGATGATGATTTFL